MYEHSTRYDSIYPQGCVRCVWARPNVKRKKILPREFRGKPLRKCGVYFTKISNFIRTQITFRTRIPINLFRLFIRTRCYNYISDNTGIIFFFFFHHNGTNELEYKYRVAQYFFFSFFQRILGRISSLHICIVFSIILVRYYGLCGRDIRTRPPEAAFTIFRRAPHGPPPKSGQYVYFTRIVSGCAGGNQSDPYMCIYSDCLPRIQIKRRYLTLQ